MGPHYISNLATDVSAAKRTVILVNEFSRSAYMSLKLSIDWRRTKLFDTSQATRTQSDMSFVASNFKLMRKTFSTDETTISNYMLKAIFSEVLPNFATLLDQ